MVGYSFAFSISLPKAYLLCALNFIYYSSSLFPSTVKMSQSWSVGIMCYNEAGTIAKVVQEVCAVMSEIAQEYEVMIVDDGSTDGSVEIIEKLARDNVNLRPILHVTNKGIGATLRSIYTNGRFENILNVPGDGQFDVKEVLQQPSLPQGHFVSFYRKENTIYNPLRNTLSLLNKKLNQFFVGITIKDVNWTKIVKREDLALLDLELKSSLIESEIVAKLLFLGRKVIEIDSRYLPRTYGVSQGSSWATVRKAIADMALLIKIMKKFRRKINLAKKKQLSQNNQ